MKGQYSLEKRITYGGQAVIEGVMIRGQSHYSLAVRKPNGEIATEYEKSRSSLVTVVLSVKAALFNVSLWLNLF